MRVEGATYFFTVNLANRASDLLIERIDDLREAVMITQAERPFWADAWVVLPDHMHCIWTLPHGDADYSTRWGAIKARFSMTVRRAGFTPPLVQPRLNNRSCDGKDGEKDCGVNPALRRNGEVGIWQRRFWEHTIRDDRDYSNHMEYCWGNPVKHGLVERVADWPYSSFHRDVRRGIVPTDWT